jgi:hypothetical protein
MLLTETPLGIELGRETEIPEAKSRSVTGPTCTTINSTIPPLTTQGVEVVLAKLKDGKVEEMTLTFSHRK